MKKLSTIKEGSIVKVVKIAAGRGAVGRLSAMGLLPNIELTVVKNSCCGAVMVTVKGSKIMLGHGMADKILVK